jgi:hypothetical protein
MKLSDSDYKELSEAFACARLASIRLEKASSKIHTQDKRELIDKAKEELKRAARILEQF